MSAPKATSETAQSTSAAPPAPGSAGEQVLCGCSQSAPEAADTQIYMATRALGYHLVPRLWVTTVTLGTLVAITHVTDTKTELREGRCSPSHGKEQKTAHVLNSMYVSPSGATVVSVTQGSTDYTQTRVTAT